MRASNCFILYSIIITELLFSSGLVMGVPAGLLDNVLNGVPNLINQLRGIKTQLKNLEQTSNQQAQLVSMIQNHVGGLLQEVETVATQLNDFKNGVQSQDNSGEQSQGSPPSNPDNSYVDPALVIQYGRQLMDMANAMGNIRGKIVI
ncbi:hypothetical protein XELAEV_18040144mg [Xenopus laevis]|uniref:Uncharacterized protein n=1 Tax=Xenopus laevis TaxID=8355 RepID=A0A974H8Q9_XENLA|nr:hypothetical protein XELAEV_18040144mg [Xenopus laevis]